MESRKTYRKNCSRSHAAYLPDISRICGIGHGKRRCGERNCFSESVPVRRVRRGSYNRSIGPEEATVRNKEDLSGTAGRRAAPPGSWRYLWVSGNICSPGRTQSVTEEKSYRAGPRLPPDRGETGARRNIPAGFCDRGGLRI